MTMHSLRMSEKQTLSEILNSQVNQVSGGIQLSLERHLSKLPDVPELGKVTKDHIAKRVPPSTRAKYLNPRSAISLLALEIVDLGTRISHYQHIERYREHFKPPDKTMRAAFVMHTHILRGNEIYVIMERCGSCLDFFHDLAFDLNLSPTRKAKSLEKQFKAEFERHLRERHRIVHAHERPSLVSRLVGVSPNELDSPDVAAAYASAMGMFAELLPNAMGDKTAGKSPEEVLALVNGRRLEAVDQECFKMWSIFLDCINKLIDAATLKK